MHPVQMMQCACCRPSFTYGRRHLLVVSNISLHTVKLVPPFQLSLPLLVEVNFTKPNYSIVKRIFLDENSSELVAISTVKITRDF